MALPLKYNYRNVLIRWRTTLFTVIGVAAVVSVVILLKALAKGIESSSARTGESGNILVVRKGSQAESGSLVTRDQFRTLQFFEEIDRNAAGQPVVSAELVMIINAPRRAAPGSANTLIRGVTPRGLELRPKVTLVEGRWFQPGQREVTVFV
jgi:putative ABC transport system permease protein